MKPLHLRIIISALAFIMLACVFYFIFRNPLLRNVVYKKTDHFNKSREAEIRYDKVYFKGLKTIHFDSLLVKPTANDTMLFIGSLSANIKILKLITGHVRSRKLNIEYARMYLDQGELVNYQRAFSRTIKSHRTDSSIVSDSNLNTRAESLLRRVFSMVPPKMIVKDASVYYTRNKVNLLSHLDLLQMKRGRLSTEVMFAIDTLKQTAEITGKIRPKKRKVELSIRPKDKESMIHSALAALFGAKVCFKSLTLDFTDKGRKGKALRLEGNCSLGRFEVDHEALSSDNIVFPGCWMKFNLSIGTNYIELDSLSEMNLGQLMMHPYLRYQMSPMDSITFSCVVPTFTVSQFYKSVPADLFPHLKYVKADGSLSYRAKLAVNLQRPDSLYIESKIYVENFKIKHIDDELLKMRYSFLHTVYEKGRPVRSFKVGPDNPEFVPLDQIPVILQNAVMLAEDNAFYYHKGFLIDAIRYAMVQNIKKGTFARGGSTISQQLVKNVYLSREKTIARKMEEIILVWLIESNRLVSKSRMFEVYLNIIEWGPNTYGVKEAARFYFNKNVGDLDVSECIFLASVIPSPKKFYYRFDTAGNLAPFMVEYYNAMSSKIFHRQLISSANGDSLSSLLRITGSAKNYLRTDTTRIDSVQLLEIRSEELRGIVQEEFDVLPIQ